MPHSYVCCHIHAIFSTKGRRNLITSELRPRLWPYLGGIAREHRMKALAVGGTANHVHIIVSIPGTVTISKAIQLIKGGSSKWVNDSFPTQEDFAWQEGYAAFAVSVSGLPEAVAYVERQREHHKTRSFEEEYVTFLERNGIEFDRRYVFD